MVSIPLDAPPLQYATLRLDPNTDKGKRVFQQIMVDLGNFWLGKPVDYLALYKRDWMEI